MNGYEINKSYINAHAEYSISDLSTFFFTKLPKSEQQKINEIARSKSLNDETETELENFKELFVKFKELAEGNFSFNRKTRTLNFYHCKKW